MIAAGEPFLEDIRTDIRAMAFPYRPRRRALSTPCSAATPGSSVPPGVRRCVSPAGLSGTINLLHAVLILRIIAHSGSGTLRNGLTNRTPSISRAVLKVLGVNNARAILGGGRPVAVPERETMFRNCVKRTKCQCGRDRHYLAYCGQPVQQ